MRAGEISRGRTTRGALSRGRLESTPPPVTHRHVLVPLPVASDDVVPLFLEPLGEVRRDEAAGAGDANLQLLLRPVLLRAVLSSELQVIVSSGRHRWCCCCVVRVVYGGGLACREPARVSARGRVNAFESAPIAKSETSAVHTATRKRTHDRRKAFDLFRVTYGAQSRSDAGQKRAGYGRSAPAALPKKPKKTFAAPPLPADTADKFFCTRRAKNDFRDVGATRGPRPRRGGVPRRERPERHPQRAEVGGEEEEPHAEQDGESPDSDPIISSRSSSSPRRRPPPDRPR